MLKNQALPESGSLPCAKDTRQKAQSTRQKGSPLGAHGEDPTATGHTANTLFAVCPLSGTRQRLHRAFLTTHGGKKKRRRDDGETAGNGGVDGFAVSQIRRTANNFKKIKKNQPAAPTAGRTPGAAAGETRGRGAAAGWRERTRPLEAPAPDLEGHRGEEGGGRPGAILPLLHLSNSVCAGRER